MVLHVITFTIVRNPVIWIHENFALEFHMRMKDFNRVQFFHRFSSLAHSKLLGLKVTSVRGVFHTSLHFNNRLANVTTFQLKAVKNSSQINRKYSVRQTISWGLHVRNIVWAVPRPGSFFFLSFQITSLSLYGAVSFWNTLCVWILYPLTSSKCCLLSLYRIIIILQSCLHSGLSNHLLLSFAHFTYFSLPFSVFHAWKRPSTKEIKADKVWLHSGGSRGTNSLLSMAPGRGIYIWIHLNNFTLTFRTLALLLFLNTYSNGDITIQSLVEQPQWAVMSNLVLARLLYRCHVTV